MFVVHTHPSLYQRRSHRTGNPLELVLEHPQYSLFPAPALADPVDLARARYMHALDEQRAAREAYAVHHLRAFQDEAAAYLRQQQQQQQQQALIAREEARQRALQARRQQIIQARREEELRRRRREREENEFAEALILAFELANQVQPAPVERAPVRPRCTCAQAAEASMLRPAGPAAPRLISPASSVPIVAPPLRLTPAPQPRVRFSPPQTGTPSSGPSLSKPATTPIVLKSVLKPTTPPDASPASVRIPIHESKGKASSHVHVNITAVAATPPALSPADAIAALLLLEADPDAMTPGTTSVPLLKHQLNTILESVDAIESGGHDAVCDMRRALVQRIEEALVAVEQGTAAFSRPQRAAGITINEPTSTQVEVKSPPMPAAVVPVTIRVAGREALAALPNAVNDLAAPPLTEAAAASRPGPGVLLEGYVVDDFLVPDALADADTLVLEQSAWTITARPTEDYSSDATNLAAEPAAFPALPESAAGATVLDSPVPRVTGSSTVDDSPWVSDAVTERLSGRP